MADTLAALHCALADLQHRPAHWWCEDVACARQFLPYFGLRERYVTVFKSTTTDQLQQCTKCQLAYHESQAALRRDLMLTCDLLEAEGVEAQWLTFDVTRLTSALQGADVTHHGQSIACALYELLAYPHLLDQPPVNAALQAFLGRAQGLALALPGPLPGLYHLTVHAAVEVRCWAQSLLESTGGRVEVPEEYERLLGPTMERVAAIMAAEAAGGAAEGASFDFPRQHYTRRFGEFWAAVVFLLRQMGPAVLSEVALVRFPHLSGTVVRLVLGSPHVTSGTGPEPRHASAFPAGAHALHVLLTGVGPRLWQRIPASARAVVEALLGHLESSCRDLGEDSVLAPMASAEFFDGPLTQAMGRPAAEEGPARRLSALLCLRLLDVIYAAPPARLPPATAADLEAQLPSVLETLLGTVPALATQPEVGRRALHAGAALLLRYAKRGQVVAVAAHQTAWGPPLLRHVFHTAVPSVTAQQAVLRVAEAEAESLRQRYTGLCRALAFSDPAAAGDLGGGLGRLWHAMREAVEDSLAPAEPLPAAFAEALLQLAAPLLLTSAHTLRCLRRFLNHATSGPPLLDVTEDLLDHIEQVVAAVGVVVTVGVLPRLAAALPDNPSLLPALLCLALSPLPAVSGGAWGGLQRLAAHAASPWLEPTVGRNRSLKVLLETQPDFGWNGLRAAVTAICLPPADGPDTDAVQDGRYLDVCVLARAPSLGSLLFWLQEVRGMLPGCAEAAVAGAALGRRLGDAGVFALWQAAMCVLRNVGFVSFHSEELRDSQLLLRRFFHFFPTLWAMVSCWQPQDPEFVGLCLPADHNQWLVVVLEAGLSLLSSGSLLGAWHAALQPCVADLFGPLGYAPTAEQRALCAELLRRAPDAQAQALVQAATQALAPPLPLAP
eukprot:EG_transcript_2697